MWLLSAVFGEAQLPMQCNATQRNAMQGGRWASRQSRTWEAYPGIMLWLEVDVEEASSQGS